MSRKRIPLNQNGCTANFRIGVPFEQNLQLHLSISNKYIWQYWRQYVSDIFETIVSIELGGFYNPELVLSDWNYLKEKIK